MQSSAASSASRSPGSPYSAPNRSREMNRDILGLLLLGLFVVTLAAAVFAPLLAFLFQAPKHRFLLYELPSVIISTAKSYTSIFGRYYASTVYLGTAHTDDSVKTQQEKLLKLVDRFLETNPDRKTQESLRSIEEGSRAGSLFLELLSAKEGRRQTLVRTFVAFSLFAR